MHERMDERGTDMDENSYKRPKMRQDTPVSVLPARSGSQSKILR